MLTAEEIKAIENLNAKKLARKQSKQNPPQDEYYPSKVAESAVGEPIPGFKSKKVPFPDNW